MIESILMCIFLIVGIVLFALLVARIITEIRCKRDLRKLEELRRELLKEGDDE